MPALRVWNVPGNRAIQGCWSVDVVGQAGNLAVHRCWSMDVVGQAAFERLL